MVTSAQGDTSQASTTRKAAGGDQKINPSIGGGMGASVATAPSASAGGIVTAPPVIQAMAKQRSGNPLFWKYGIDDGGGVF